MTIKTLWAGFGLGLALLVFTQGARANEEICDRACLYGFVDQYLSAMLAHDPSLVSIASDAKFTENGVELQLPDGLWRIANGLDDDYAITFAEPATGQIGGFRRVFENGAPVLLALRLKVENLKFTEMETIVIRNAPGMFAVVEDAIDRPEFETVLPPEQRRSRNELIAIANIYFEAIEKNDGSLIPPFENCERWENGILTSDNTAFQTDDGSYNPLAMSCERAMRLGYYREDTRLRDRRWLIVDEERGLVFGGVFFDHDAVLREYNLTDGTPFQVSHTEPWTWHILELFKITDGKIGAIEAVVGAVPYGMRSGWDSE